MSSLSDKRMPGVPVVGPWKWLILPWMLTMVALSYLWAGEFAGFQMPGAMRIIFWHVPQAILALVWYAVAAWYGVRYLIRRDLFDDTRSATAAEIGLLLTLLAAASGAIFAKVQWGQYWGWDPKQVGITLLTMLYLAYFALRLTVADPRTRANLSAGYAVVGLVGAFFCYYVLPRVGDTLHPGTNVVGSAGGMDTPYRTTFWMSVAGFLALTICLYRLKLAVEQVAAVLAARAASPAGAEAPRLEPERRPVGGDVRGEVGGK